MDYKSFIADNLQKTSELCRQQFGKVSSTVKVGDNNQVLTETDIAVGKLLVAAIQKQFPQHSIIDEEAGVIDNTSDYIWIVDPIDGTSNFANGIPTYGTFLGLLHNYQPIAGGIALPNFNDIVIAEQGKGAWRNDQRIYISAEKDLKNVLVAYGIDGRVDKPEHTQREMLTIGEIANHSRNIRTSNSAFDAVLMTDGRYGASLNQNSKIWDNAAQQIVIEEAGGIYTDFFGQPIDYSDGLQNPEKNFTWCAASPTLHKQLQQITHHK